MKWSSDVVGVREHVPLLIADAKTWSTWRGEEEPQDSYDMLEGVVGAADSNGRALVPFGYEGGVFEIGIGENELVVLQHYASDNEHRFDRLREAIATRAPQEFLAGELEVNGGVIVGDCWANGSAFDFGKLTDLAQAVAELVYFVPLLAGTYLVLEATSEDDEAAWYRFVKGSATNYERREE